MLHFLGLDPIGPYQKFFTIWQPYIANCKLSSERELYIQHRSILRIRVLRLLSFNILRGMVSYHFYLARSALRVIKNLLLELTTQPRVQSVAPSGCRHATLQRECWSIACAPSVDLQSRRLFTRAYTIRKRRALLLSVSLRCKVKVIDSKLGTGLILIPSVGSYLFNETWTLH